MENTRPKGLLVSRVCDPGHRKTSSPEKHALRSPVSLCVGLTGVTPQARGFRACVWTLGVRMGVLCG